MDDVLTAVAASQGGAFTHAQALAAGCTAGQIRGALRRQWADPFRGVYVDRQRLESADARERHVVLAAARLLSSTLEPVASHRTAALVHGLPLLGPPPKVPQLTRAPRYPRDRSSSSTVRVAPLPPPDVTEVAGVRVTSLARTACDVARTASFRDAVVVADAVLRRGTSPATLVETAARCRTWPGGGRAARVVAFADGRADGPLESISRVAYAQHGLPAPETQVEVWSPHGVLLGLVDFLWREARVVGEADGLGKYESALALRREKVREEGLRACGLEVVRHGWDDVWTAGARERLSVRVRQAFSFAAARPLLAGVVFRTPALDQLLVPPWQRDAA